jgi:hypothetical protein
MERDTVTDLRAGRVAVCSMLPPAHRANRAYRPHKEREARHERAVKFTNPLPSLSRITSRQAA